MSDMKPTLSLAWDGTIFLGAHDRRRVHRPLEGTLVPGFFEWAEQAQKRFMLSVDSSRCATEEGRVAMGRWLAEQMRSWEGDPIMLRIASERPPAWLKVDPRVVRFDGDWNAPELQPEMLRAFKPWNER